MEYVLKHKNEDFLVDEVISIQYCKKCHNAYGIFRLLKSGITTFDAIDRIALFFKIPTREIGYAGLKDEDAVTNQHISIPFSLLPDNKDLERFNKKNDKGNSYINLLHLGFSMKDIKIGTAMGNSLTIIVRNLEKKWMQTLGSISGVHKVRVCFPNFYDTQRFGLPNSPKMTHLVGKHLLEKDYETAFSILRKIEALDSTICERYIGNYQSFFFSLDKRKLSFYFNSFASAFFNDRLNSLMDTLGDVSLHTLSGINYKLANNIKIFDGMETLHGTLEYNRDSINSEGILERSKCSRPAILQCYIDVGECERDIYHDNRLSLKVSFFMPAGAYATMVVRQLLCYIGHDGLQN